MASTINFSSFVREVQDVTDLKKLIYEAVFTESPFTGVHTIYDGIKADQHIGTIGSYGLVGRAAQGCNPTAHTGEVPITKKTWTPKRWEIILDTCYNDIDTTIAMYAAKIGVNRFDLSGTEINKIIETRLAEAIEKMLWRKAWFDNTTAANSDDSPAGAVTPGVDVDFLNLINGFWKQIAAIYGTNAKQRTTISKNAQSTYADQALTDQECFEAIEAVYKNATPALKQANNQAIMTTGYIAEGYRRHMSKTYGYNLAYEKIAQGVSKLNYNGLDLLGFWIWDETIASYFNTGTKYDSPNRILYTTKDNLAVGVEGVGNIDNVNSFYDPTTRLWRLEASDKIDVKIIQNDLLQVGI